MIVTSPPVDREFSRAYRDAVFRLLARLTAVAALATMTVSCAAEDSLDGFLSDAHCEGTHEWDEHGPPLTEHDCTLMCVKRGAAFVLVSGGRVYKIENQDHPDLPMHAGEVVRVTGRVQDDTVSVSTLGAPRF
jgi:hypothetical protein